MSPSITADSWGPDEIKATEGPNDGPDFRTKRDQPTNYANLEYI